MCWLFIAFFNNQCHTASSFLRAKRAGTADPITTKVDILDVFFEIIGICYQI